MPNKENGCVAAKMHQPMEQNVLLQAEGSGLVIRNNKKSGSVLACKDRKSKHPL
jgi:hypothetical protein